MTYHITLTEFDHIDNIRQNAAYATFQALKHASALEDVVLEIPAGDYHFYPEKAYEEHFFVSNNGGSDLRKVAFPIIGCRRLKIVGNDANLIFHGHIVPFLIKDSSNISVEGVRIDWQHPFTAQAVITEIADDYIICRMDEGFTYKVEDGKLYLTGEDWTIHANHSIEVEKDTYALGYLSGDRVLGTKFESLHVEDLGESQFKLSGTMSRAPKLGNYLVFSHHVRTSPGFCVLGSTDITIKDTTVYHAVGMGVVGQNSTNITVSGFKAERKGTRAFTLMADGLHFVNCRGQIVIEDCSLTNQLDDAVNVHGNYIKIEEMMNEHTVMARLMHPEQWGVDFGYAGDKVNVVRKESLTAYASNTIRSIEKINRELLVIEFESALSEEAKIGDVLENMSWVPDLTIKGCKIGSNRPRGLLIKTPGKVLVENNDFHTAGAAIMFRYDAHFWYESGAVKDVTIRNNVFENCNYVPQWGGAVIALNPWVTAPDKKTEPCHANIRIYGNVFKTFTAALLRGYLTDGVEFCKNEIIETDAYPEHSDSKYCIELFGCKNVFIHDNYCSDRFKLASVNGQTVEVSDVKGKTG